MSKVENQTDPSSLRESIFADIERGENLLSLPATLAKVIEVINDENASVDSLAAAIQRDPSLTATIVRMANTPYYGRMSRCSSLSDAVMTLGSLTMKSIALTATALNPKNIREQCGINPEEFVANSITVATMAREIAVAVEYSCPEDALMAGLLHDIGVLYFMGNQTEIYRDVTAQSVAGESLVESEISVLGVSHMEVGEALMRRWHLPEKIRVCVGGHHHAEAAMVADSGSAADEVLLKVVQLAVAVSGDSYLQYRRKLDCDLNCVNGLMKTLGLSDDKLSAIVSSVLSDSLEVAAGFGMEESAVETLMSQANKKLGQYLNSLQRLMRDREELSAKILNEERRKGVAESRIAIMATLSHHINNSAMVVMGKAEALSVTLQPELSDKAYKVAAKDLQAIVNSIEKIKHALEKMSHVAEADIMRVHDTTATLDLDTLIKDSARLDKSALPLCK